MAIFVFFERRTQLSLDWYFWILINFISTYKPNKFLPKISRQWLAMIPFFNRSCIIKSFFFAYYKTLLVIVLQGHYYFARSPNCNRICRNIFRDNTASSNKAIIAYSNSFQNSNIFSEAHIITYSYTPTTIEELSIRVKKYICNPIVS